MKLFVVIVNENWEIFVKLIIFFCCSGVSLAAGLLIIIASFVELFVNKNNAKDDIETQHNNNNLDNKISTRRYKDKQDVKEKKPQQRGN